MSALHTHIEDFESRCRKEAADQGIRFQSKQLLILQQENGEREYLIPDVLYEDGHFKIAIEVERLCHNEMGKEKVIAFRKSVLEKLGYTVLSLSGKIVEENDAPAAIKLLQQIIGKREPQEKVILAPVKEKSDFEDTKNDLQPSSEISDEAPKMALPNKEKEIFPNAVSDNLPVEKIMPEIEVAPETISEIEILEDRTGSKRQEEVLLQKIEQKAALEKGGEKLLPEKEKEKEVLISPEVVELDYSPEISRSTVASQELDLKSISGKGILSPRILPTADHSQKTVSRSQKKRGFFATLALLLILAPLLAFQFQIFPFTPSQSETPLNSPKEEIWKESAPEETPPVSPESEIPKLSEIEFDFPEDALFLNVKEQEEVWEVDAHDTEEYPLLKLPEHTVLIRYKGFYFLDCAPGYEKVGTIAKCITAPKK
jgi:hypothetical protein